MVVTPVEPALTPSCVAALRTGRAALLAAARADVDDEIAAAVSTYVPAMVAARFSMTTVRGLVEAALHAGLPKARGRSDRAARSRRIERWVAAADDAAVLARSLDA